MDKDRYGRTVAIIILPDGRNLNHEIVPAGFAWWFRRYAAHDAMLQRLDAEARAVGRGLGAEKDAVLPGNGAAIGGTKKVVRSPPSQWHLW